MPSLCNVPAAGPVASSRAGGRASSPGASARRTASSARRSGNGCASTRRRHGRCAHARRRGAIGAKVRWTLEAKEPGTTRVRAGPGCGSSLPPPRDGLATVPRRGRLRPLPPHASATVRTAPTLVAATRWGCTRVRGPIHCGGVPRCARRCGGVNASSAVLSASRPHDPRIP